MKDIAVLAAALAVAGVGVPAAAAQTVAGRPQVSGSQPAGRAWPSLAYDPALGELVLFGGDNGRTVYGRTWVYQDGTWTQEHPAQSPAPRTGAALVYDAATGQLLLFGGSSKIGTAGGYFGDTWTWNGSTWTQQDTPAAPAPRDTGSFAYDTAAGTGILYGGFNGVTAFTDTWTWNGSTWTKLSIMASPGRVTAGWQMADDAATGQILLFGGGRYDHTNAAATWAWTGSTWTRLRPVTSPLGRGIGSMTYDSSGQRILLFGGQGYHQDTYPAATWSWDGTTWQKLN